MNLEYLSYKHIDTIVAEYNSEFIRPLITDDSLEIGMHEIEAMVNSVEGKWFAIYEDYNFVGVCGLHNLCKNDIEISITVFPRYQSKGVGKFAYKKLLLLAQEYYCAKTVTAKIIANNERSIRFHISCGFVFFKLSGNVVEYRYDLTNKLTFSQRLSVIIPTYNSGKTIKRTLESLSSLPSENTQIIVVDDASNDNTIEIIKSFKDVILIQNRKNMLPGFSRNLGISTADGAYIYFLDSDDEAIAYWLYKMFILAITLETDVIYTNKYLDDNDNCRVYIKFFYSGEVSIEQKRKLLQNQFIVWTAIYKKEFLILNDIRFFEGGIYEDNQLSFYIALNVRYIAFFDKIIVRHYNLPYSLSKTKTLHLFDNIEIAYRIYKDIIKSDIYQELQEEIDLWFYYFEYVQTLRSCLINEQLDMLSLAFNNLQLIDKPIWKNKYIQQHTQEQRDGIRVGLTSCEQHFKYIKENKEARL